jgi:hypothetical protein
MLMGAVAALTGGIVYTLLEMRRIGRDSDLMYQVSRRNKTLPTRVDRLN